MFAGCRLNGAGRILCILFCKSMEVGVVMSKVLRPLDQVPETAGPPQPPVKTVRKVIASGYVPVEDRAALATGRNVNSKILSIPKRDDSLMGGYTGIGSIAKDSNEAVRYSKAAQDALKTAQERAEHLAKLKRGGGISEFIDVDGQEQNAAAYAFAGLS